MSKKFNKNKWIAEVREALGTGIKTDSLLSSCEELVKWNKDSDCSFDDVEHGLRLAFEDVYKKVRSLEYLIYKEGWPFINKCRDIQNCLDMEEIGRIAGFPNDNPPYTIGELRET